MRKIAKQNGLGNFDNASDPLTPSDEEKLWAANLMGDHSPKALIRGLWFTTSKPMGMFNSIKLYYLVIKAAISTSLRPTHYDRHFNLKPIIKHQSKTGGSYCLYTFFSPFLML